MNEFTVNDKKIYCNRPSRLGSCQFVLDEFYKTYSKYSHLYKKEDWGLDLGAGFGDSSVMMGLFVDKVICIEPILESFKLLQENTKNNNYSSFDLYNICVSDKDEQLDFMWGDGNGGIVDDNKFCEQERGNMSPNAKLDCKDLYSFLVSTYNDDLNKIKFIKIDCEGYDYVLLDNIKPIIDKNKPVIIMEWWFYEPKNKFIFSSINNIRYKALNSNGIEVFENDFYTNKKTQDLFLLPN